MDSSELILRISVTAAALIWNQVAFLHGEQESAFLAEHGLVEMRRRLADHLNRLAEAVERKISLPAEHLEAFVSQHLLESGHFDEYAKNTIARYEDLQASHGHNARPRGVAPGNWDCAADQFQPSPERTIL